MSRTFLARARSHAARDFDYQLPSSKIAYYPLSRRDESKLLVARVPGDAHKGVDVSHRRFSELAQFVPEGALMVINDSKVIQARLPAVKETGGRAEVLLLRPAAGLGPSDALRRPPGESNTWVCMVGGKKLREGTRLFARDARDVEMTIAGSREGGVFDVRFGAWNQALHGATFGELVDKVGSTPLPPYIRREAETNDRQTYQTVYAETAGSVAAPTAGLHLTEEVMASLRRRHVDLAHVTLHVGAGTFAPIAGDHISKHTMHAERVEVSARSVDVLADARAQGRPIVCVGTTAARTLESLYWNGTRALLSGTGAKDSSELMVRQWEPYERMDESGDALPGAAEALRAVLQKFPAGVFGETQLLVVPPYKFRVMDALVTNFHQPQSTLLMMVAAFLGGTERLWQVYTEALESDYRFLSYGDSSILLPPGSR